jgi:hypothetical protein
MNRDTVRAEIDILGGYRRPGGQFGADYCSALHPTEPEVYCRRPKNHDGEHAACHCSRRRENRQPPPTPAAAPNREETQPMSDEPTRAGDLIKPARITRNRIHIGDIELPGAILDESVYVKPGGGSRINTLTVTFLVADIEITDPTQTEMLAK